MNQSSEKKNYAIMPSAICFNITVKKISKIALRRENEAGRKKDRKKNKRNMLSFNIFATFSSKMSFLTPFLMV